jgi:hypothetical protein
MDFESLTLRHFFSADMRCVRVIRIQMEGELYAMPLVRIDRVAHLELVASADAFSRAGATSRMKTSARRWST